MDTRTYSYSYDEETFHGKYATRADVISAAGKNAFDGRLAEGTKIWIGRNELPPHVRELMIGAADFVEYIAERVGEEYGECSQDFLDVDAEQKAEIQRRLDEIADYIQSFDAPTFYLIQDVEPFVVPEA